MKKERNSFFGYGYGNNMVPNQAVSSASSFYQGPVMDNTNNMYSDIDSRLSKIERRLSRLENRVSNLEGDTTNYDDTYSNNNMYMV